MADNTSINITIDRLMPGDNDSFNQWCDLLEEIFTDESDREPRDQLLSRLESTEKNLFFMFRDEQGKPVGFELLQLDPLMPGHKVAYVPWAGMIEEHRNHGVYPAISKQIMDITASMGVACMLHEIEDPKRIHAAYDEQPGGEMSVFAERRSHFWRRSPMDSLIIDDGTTGDEGSLTAYVRPASDDDNAIQAYDLMALRQLDKTHPMFSSVENGGIFNDDKTAVSIAAYRRLYLQMTQIQYEEDMPLGLSETEYYSNLQTRLRSTYPAVENFCARLDKAEALSPFVALNNTPIRERSTPSIQANLHIGPNLPQPQKPAAKTQAATLQQRFING